MFSVTPQLTVAVTKTLALPDLGGTLSFALLRLIFSFSVLVWVTEISTVPEEEAARAEALAIAAAPVERTMMPVREAPVVFSSSVICKLPSSTFVGAIQSY